MFVISSGYILIHYINTVTAENEVHEFIDVAANLFENITAL